MTDGSGLFSGLPAVGGKPVRLAFDGGGDLCSPPTISRLENLPGPIALKRMMAAMIDLFYDSFVQVPERMVLDIDDTEDEVHSGQQLALFNAHVACPRAGGAGPVGQPLLPAHPYLRVNAG